MSARKITFLACLTLVLSLSLNAGELTKLSASLRQRILNADRLLELAEGDLRTVRQQFETQRQLNSESESDWTARENDWKLDESLLRSEIALLKAEKAALEEQEASSAQDSQSLIDLTSLLAEERTAADRSRRMSFVKGAGVGAGLALIGGGVFVLTR